VSELDDDAVVQLVLAGDTDQFAILVRRYQVLVRTYCGQILGDRERGWDESQEVFLKAFNRLSSFRGDSQFSTWLMKIARNREKVGSANFCRLKMHRSLAAQGLKKLWRLKTCDELFLRAFQKTKKQHCC